MLPINFEGSNTPMVKPQNMTEEECGDLQVRHLSTLKGPTFTSCWKPNYEDIKNLEAGKAVIIQMQMNDPVFIDIDTCLKTDFQFYAFCRAAVWIPSYAQLKAIQAGGGIYLTYLTDRFPVTSVYINEH
jgi:hypothetical protein